MSQVTKESQNQNAQGNFNQNEMVQSTKIQKQLLCLRHAGALTMGLVVHYSFWQTLQAKLDDIYDHIAQKPSMFNNR